MAVAKGYVRVVDIGLMLGVDLTVTQQMQLTRLLPSAEAAIDHATQSAWLTGAITSERHSPAGPRLYLRARPITSVQAVLVRYCGWHTWSALQATTSGYEIESAADGVLGLWDGGRYDQALVSYTPDADAEVPAPISEATARLAWTWVSRTPDNVGGDLKAFTVFDQLQVTYRDPSLIGPTRGLPLDVWALCAPYARMGGVCA